MPDDPPLPLEEYIQAMQNIPAFVDVYSWATWNQQNSAVIALGHVDIARTADNKHIAQMSIQVSRSYRKQGIGSSLLQKISEVVKNENRRLLLAETTSNIPAGEAFLTKMGGEKGLETHENQLRIEELNKGLIETWLQRGQVNQSEFFLGLWEGAYPEEQMDAVLALYELENQQPFGGLEVEDMHLTKEQLRQIEKQMFARGGKRWTFYLIERATGKMAGYTETIWMPNRPQLLYQEMTGVFPEYRNKGLGRWLKAAMLDKVIHERPEVQYVRTGNADSNAPMLKINTELGFKPYISNSIWQIPMEKVEAYLEEKSAPHTD